MGNDTPWFQFNIIDPRAGETTTNLTALQGCFYGVIHILNKSKDRASHVIAWRTCMTYAWEGIHGWQP